MFKKLMNEAIFSYELETYSPLLIQGKGNESLSPTDVDISYIKTHKAGKMVPYIPGSSLKGVFRSYSESIIEAACDIVGKNRNYIENGVSKKCLSQYDKEYKYMTGEERYTKSCLVCKLFGSDTLKSRIAFSNAYPCEDYKIETAGMTAIDRVKGGAKSGALRDIEYVGYGVFEGKVKITNFAPYQIKLILNNLQALEMGEIRLGSYTSKGFGEIGVRNLRLTLRYYNKEVSGYQDQGFYVEKQVEGIENILALVSNVTYKDVNINGKTL